MQKELDIKLYNNLGVVYQSLGESKKAIELFQRGLRIAKETGNKDAEGTRYKAI